MCNSSAFWTTVFLCKSIYGEILCFWKKLPNQNIGLPDLWILLLHLNSCIIFESLLCKWLLKASTFFMDDEKLCSSYSGQFFLMQTKVSLGSASCLQSIWVAMEICQFKLGESKNYQLSTTLDLQQVGIVL